MVKPSDAGECQSQCCKFVAKKHLSPSKDFKKEDIKEYKVSEPSTLHLARPSVACCGSSAQHNNRTKLPRDGAEVCCLETNRCQFQAQTISGGISPPRLHGIQSERGEGTKAKLIQINL